jgi:hypothetical protein
MKYKKQFLLIFLLLVLFVQDGVTQILSSKFNVTYGPVEEEKRSSFDRTVCSYEDYFIIIRRIKKTVSLEKLNSKLVSVKALDITEFEEADGKERVFTDVIYFNDKIFLITTKNIKKKSTTVYYQEINLDDFELGSEIKILSETDLTGKKKPKTRFIFGGIGMSNLMAELGDYSNNDLITSPDDKKLLTYNKSFDDRDGPDVISVKIQNENFETDWENDSISLPYNSLLFDIKKVRINNKSDIILSGIEYNEKRKSKKDKAPNYKYHIIGIFNKGKEIKDYEIKLSNKFVSDLQFKFEGENTLVVAGFYSETDASNIKGAFFMKINLDTKEVINETLKPFGFDFIVSGLSEREQEKQKKKEEKGKEIELMDFDLDDIILHDNGTYSLIAEQFDIQTYQTYQAGTNGSPGTWTTHYKYYYNDIIVVNISKEGEINWMSKINKFQVSTDDGGYYSSYAYSVVNDNIYLVYNDHPDNLEQTLESKFKSYRRGKETVQMIIEINPEGQVTKEVLFNTEKGEVVLRPKSCISSEKGDLMLFANRKNEYQFDLIQFK